MYFKHYHLTKKPFGLTPGPDFFWFSEKHKEALATLRYGILGDLGFLLLTGEVGVGKTALIHRLLTSLDSSTIVAHITDPGLSINDFFKLLAVEFGIDTPFNSKGEFLIILERFLHQAYQNKKKVLLIVDEAQRVNSVLLDQIRVLSNIELNDHKLINIFFIGQPEFKKILKTNSNRPIRQRIAIYYHVQPLDEMETGQYIEHRLEIAGARRKIFMPDAIHEIHRISHGYPRAINILCDHALLTGYAAGKQTVDASIVKECENELNIDSEDDFDFSHSMTQSSANMTPQPLPKSVPESGAASMASVASVKPKPPPLNFEIRPKPKPKPAPIPAMLSQKSKVWYYPVVIVVAITMVAVAGFYFLGLGPDKSGSMQDATGPINFKLSDPQANQSASPPASPESGNALAQSNSGVETNITVRPEAQPAVEPPPDTAETAPETAIPEPRPDTPERTSVADEPASIKQEAPSTDHASTKTPAEEPDASEEKQPVPDVAAVSPQAVSEQPTVTEQPETTQNNAGSPASESAEQSDKPSSSFPPLQPPATSEGASVSPTKETTATSPPPEPATPLATEPRVADPSQAIVGTPSVSTPTQNLETPASAAADPPAQKEEPGTTPAEPALPETAALQPQDTQPQPAAEKPTVDDALKRRVRAFIQEYCNTYSAKDLYGLTDFFTAEATENGKPFAAMLPKYRKNFTFIDTIYYRIELQAVKYEEDGKTLKADGKFFFRWLPPDKKWRENAGKITMRLQKSDDSFQVHRLDYQANR